ncbi:hypothetical protein FKW77_007929 [Venturia effusa]|uniref:Uncharacterized protein n=1 Tax=Venturia effusa TaxID=50376 RepID=A0A517L9N3_9PEZI|nr:hypothetical protein FKW77_007929 [Venturia effusa]
MTSKEIVLVTGANTGLGLAIVKALVQSGKAYTILLGGRDINKAEAATQQLQAECPEKTSSIYPVQIDIEVDDSIQKLFDEISSRYGRVDTLINNAGASFDSAFQSGQITTLRETWNKSWDVNVSGTNVLTHTLAPLLLQAPNPRLLFITSGTANLTDHDNQALAVNRSPEKGWPKSPAISVPAYRSAKTGLNMLMREWYRTLKNDGVKTWAISPGLLATGLGGNGEEFMKKMGAGDPADGAALIREVVEGKYDEDTGKIVGRAGIQSW